MRKKLNSKEEQIETNQIGIDGWLTLVLSNIVLILTSSFTLIWMFIKVIDKSKHSLTYTKNQADLILVAGMRLENGHVNKDYKQRLDRAKKLFTTHNCPILIMGGITDGGSYSEASVGRGYLVERGVPLERIQLEDKSRNTLENLQNTKKTIKNNDLPSYVLISNRYHLARIEALSNGLGLFPDLCAAEDENSIPSCKWWRYFLESYYLHWYFTGKIWSTITKNQHSLNRIR